VIEWRSMKFLLLVLVATSLWAADPVAPTNGRTWEAFSLEAKLAYLRGVYEGNVTTVLACEKFAYQERVMLPEKLTMGEIVRSLDHFYDEPTNGPVFLIGAILYVRLKAEGASETELKELEISLRRTSNK
jgi:hypothetical protein